ncbi:MAG TPA: DUF3152 domain-containing protein [Micromonosporaceae bacterium]|nr:DUF3152 domain-containing protein [Micromonosporaceae bacterium]
MPSYRPLASPAPPPRGGDPGLDLDVSSRANGGRRPTGPAGTDVGAAATTTITAVPDADRTRRRQRLMVGVLALVAVVILGGLAVTRVLGWPHHGKQRAASGTSTATPGVLPSGVPTTGTGKFTLATTTSAVLGTAGTLETFHVGTEKGAETAKGGEDANAFAADVVAILGDQQSWIAGGKFRFQQVPTATKATFTVYLATETTAEKMCGAGGFHTDDLTSCHLPNQVVINLSRWKSSVAGYGASLATYRAYDINHEVGRQIGYLNQACPGPGKLAPVMMAQALGLQGCVANPYPYPNGTYYSGPQIPA